MYQDTDNVTALEARMATDTSTIRAGAEIFTPPVGSLRHEPKN